MAKPFKVFLDPGHGMGNRSRGKFDPGAVANGVREADKALELALTIKYIGTTDPRFAGKFDFEFSRTDNVKHTSLGSRVSLATQFGADVFLSIHNNAASPAATGTETFYRSKSKDFNFASIVQKAALKAFKLRDRGVKHESKAAHKRLAVLGGSMPSALLETGFITNKQDVKAYDSARARIDFAVEFLTALVKAYRL